jgi:ribosomal protein S18 acetylase RimI-like enzyme
MDVTIRQATEKDIDTVVELWWEMMDFHARSDDRFHPLHQAEAMDAWEKHLRADVFGNEGWCILVAESDEQVVGMMIGTLHDPYPVFEPERFGFVADAVVAPVARRTGVGRALFDALKTWFRQQGVSHVQLEVGHLNPTSQAFWRAMGCSGYMDTLWYDLSEG